MYKSVTLAGDGRCDSPDSSAKYCTYSVLDIDTNTIIHAETFDKRNVSKCDHPWENQPSSHLVVIVDIPVLKFLISVTSFCSC